MAKTDRMMGWAKEIEFHLAEAIARADKAAEEAEEGVPSVIFAVSVDVVEKLVECRQNLNFLILLIGKWQSREG